VSCPLLENATCRTRGSRVVKFPKRVDQQNVQYVPGASRCSWTSAGMEFLRNLLWETQTWHRCYDRNPEFHETSDPGFNLVNVAAVGRPKIHFDRLPGAGSILDGYRAEILRALRG